MAFIDYLLNGDNNPADGYVEFVSTDHIRYEHDVDVSGHNYNCRRKIRIEKNIEGDEGYTVTIFNLDGIHPLWQDNVQMSPKKMRINKSDGELVLLEGYGVDKFGHSFAGYSLGVRIRNGEIDTCILYMNDRGVRIAYIP